VVPTFSGRRAVRTASIIAFWWRAQRVDTHTAVYDLEPPGGGHTRRKKPKVRRIKTPHKVHPAFDASSARPAVLEVLTCLLGPDLRCIAPSST